MAYDEGLAERIRAALEDVAGVTEKRMFGGIAFLVRGNMGVGIVQDKLMVRVGPESYDRLLRERHVRRMDFTGRPMKGFVYVVPAGYETDEGLARWVGAGVAHATSLPAKAPGESKPRRPARRKTTGKAKAGPSRARAKARS